ncbi:LAQU0S02e02894g1_1 [Lachancea quebecensis]|uniref:LAQU0S02e02894g1_1 n=1 Tax=Lachancea quebecensis TaxID=1654605 RepID=A0A0P1KP42_9SACH|nr:LAQU0S02e02894g1_1 [Lachancea quebecensis]
MGRIHRFFANPGSRPSVSQRAPLICVAEEPNKPKALYDGLQVVDSQSDESSVGELGEVEVKKEGCIVTSHGFTGLQKGWSDRLLDRVVLFAGSQIVFFLMWVIMVIWIIIGIVYKAPENWQVVMQDGQSLQSYIWDTLLMRQQLISAHDHVNVCAILRSRLRTFKRLCKSYNPTPNKKEEAGEPVESRTYNVEVVPTENMGGLPIEGWYDRLSSFAGKVIGSLPFMIIFWIGIFVWIGCGALPLDAGNQPPYTGKLSGSNPKMKKFSDRWQLYINTATAVVLLVCTMFLQNIRARHDKFITKGLAAVFDIDQEIEQYLRAEAGDFTTPNDVVTVHSKKRSMGEKCIDWYADIIGTGIGIFIAAAAIGAWLGVGNVMNWNSNWWLIIGTYTGLIGFLDGFVLRQVYFRIVSHEQENYDTVAQEDLELFQNLGIHCPDELIVNHESSVKKTIPFKISLFINKICSSQWSVLVSIIIIIALIAIASGLHWSTTGQLIANTPTMIIEAFFLIVLIQAHTWADQRRRIDVSSLFARRCILRSHVKGKYQ